MQFDLTISMRGATLPGTVNTTRRRFVARSLSLPRHSSARRSRRGGTTDGRYIDKRLRSLASTLPRADGGSIRVLVLLAVLSARQFRRLSGQILGRIERLARHPAESEPPTRSKRR